MKEIRFKQTRLETKKKKNENKKGGKEKERKKEKKKKKGEEYRKDQPMIRKAVVSSIIRV